MVGNLYLVLYLKKYFPLNWYSGNIITNLQNIWYLPVFYVIASKVLDRNLSNIDRQFVNL